MESLDYISIALSAYLIIVGLASFFTGKVYAMGRSASKYTEESLKQFSRPYGLSYIVGGAGLLMYDLLENELFKIGTFSVTIGMVGLVVLVLISFVIYAVGKKVLVKK